MNHANRDGRSRFDLREELLAAVVKDLLGPAGGPEEEVAGTTLRDRYLVGQLAPKGSRVDPGEFDDLAQAGDQNSQEGEPDDERVQKGSLMPSSIGMTFRVVGDADEVQVTASWGHYWKGPSEELVTQSGEPRRVWKRRPSGGAVELALAEGEVEPRAPDPEQPEVVVEGVVRRVDGDWVVTLFLVNEQEMPDSNEEEAWVFQPKLRVEGAAGRPVFRSRWAEEDRTGAGEGPEHRILAMLYRTEVEFAIGHGVAVHADVLSEDPTRATAINTRIIPVRDVPETEAPTVDDRPGLSDVVLDMEELAELGPDELVETLSILVSEYEDWIEANEERVSAGEVGQFSDAAKDTIANCRSCLQRLREGIHLLGADREALEAFRFANQSMHLQRIRSEYTRRLRRGEDLELSDVDVPENRSWYPFQLAFLLLNLPSVTDPAHPHRSDPANAIADLLWFPTGGGKTEAYLGVAAYVMGLRRLQGTVDGYDGRAGVAVIMRYTLRLLTIQQFQRAAALICAMEVLRRREEDEGRARWGTEPFRIGLWVGARATPNTTKGSAYAIKEGKGDAWSGGGGGTPYQITNCPWCGREIELGRDVVVDEDIGRTLTYCSDEFGQCEFSRRRAHREGIPIVVVDEEVYRLLPALLIGTVDKFAQMPWKGETQTLFGRVEEQCPRHGFLNSGSDCSGSHRSKGDLPSTEPRNVGPLRPPDLIIQDELHLISGPLGTMVGLYETAVDQLCQWSFDEQRVYPKVVASTATIRRAQDQVHDLFTRRVAIFPPKGLDIGDDFFSVRREISEKHPGRRYFGICAPGRDRPAVLIRVYVALLTAARNLLDEYGELADPWMTLVGYFNSLRELGGMRRLVEDDVNTRAFKVDMQHDLTRPGLSQRDVRQVEELTSRRSSADIPKVLDWLEVPFTGGDGGNGRGKDSPRPIDVLLATNMISVGVDVRRLGLMVVNGQPKTTAEYIQATSRVGRASPGVVCSVLNWSRPRDLSHYETFEHYHATFYQHVEALSVTPYAARAVDRGLAGVLVSLLRLREAELNPNPGAERLDREAEYADRVVEEVEERAHEVTHDPEVRRQVAERIRSLLDHWAAEAEISGRHLGYEPSGEGDTAGLLRGPTQSGWGPFTLLHSLRDVEPNVNLILGEASSGSDGPAFERPSDEGAE